MRCRYVCLDPRETTKMDEREPSRKISEDKVQDPTRLVCILPLSAVTLLGQLEAQYGTRFKPRCWVWLHCLWPLLLLHVGFGWQISESIEVGNDSHWLFEGKECVEFREFSFWSARYFLNGQSVSTCTLPN